MCSVALNMLKYIIISLSVCRFDFSNFIFVYLKSYQVLKVRFFVITKNRLWRTICSIFLKIMNNFFFFPLRITWKTIDLINLRVHTRWFAFIEKLTDVIGLLTKGKKHNINFFIFHTRHASIQVTVRTQTNVHIHSRIWTRMYTHVCIYFVFACLYTY